MRLSPDARTHIALVVDDQATARQRISSILADAGWRVSTAGSAAEALDKARAERPAIIFMDIVMPGMDGYQACRKLAVDPATRAIPVVFVSTKCQRADQVWARMQGGKALIGKPYSDAQVLDALRFAAR
jgi:twitching motility two-component system response regulator PilH